MTDNGPGDVPDWVSRMHANKADKFKQKEPLQRSQAELERERQEREERKKRRYFRYRHLEDINSYANLMLLAGCVGILLFAVLLYAAWGDDIRSAVPERETLNSWFESWSVWFLEWVSYFWSEFKSLASDAWSSTVSGASWILGYAAAPLVWGWGLVTWVFGSIIDWLSSNIYPLLPSWETTLKTISFLVVVGVVKAFRKAREYRELLVREAAEKEQASAEGQGSAEESAGEQIILPGQSLLPEYWSLRRELWFGIASLVFFALVAVLFLISTWRAVHINSPGYAGFFVVALIICVGFIIYLVRGIRVVLNAMKWYETKLPRI